jgi:hypothetical protein
VPVQLRFRGGGSEWGRAATWLQGRATAESGAEERVERVQYVQLHHVLDYKAGGRILQVNGPNSLCLRRVVNFGPCPLPRAPLAV